MNEKRFIPGTNPEWGRELPDGDVNSLVDKAGNNWDNGYNFDEKDDDLDIRMQDVPAFDPEKARKLYEAEHPNAVRDVEKARRMAKAGDVVRVVEQEARKEVQEAIDTGKTGEVFEDKLRHYVEAGKLANAREEYAGERYDNEQQNKQEVGQSEIE